MGIYPPLWGASYWALLHTNAKRLDAMRESSDEKYAQKAAGLLKWFDATCEGLLCDVCEYHCHMNLNTSQLPRSAEEGSMFTWTVALHNEVNQRKGKRTVSLTEAESMLDELYGEEQVEKVDRAEQVRREDHAKIKRLVNELERLGYHDPDGDVGNPVLGYRLVAFVTGLVVGMVFLLALWFFSRLLTK
jgi:hypothetical protein